MQHIDEAMEPTDDDMQQQPEEAEPEEEEEEEEDEDIDDLLSLSGDEEYDDDEELHSLDSFYSGESSMCSDPVTRMCRSNCHCCCWLCCCCCVEHRKLPYRVLSGLPETTLRGALHLCRGCRFVWRRRPSWWPNYVLKTPNSNQHQAGNDPLRSLTLVPVSPPPFFSLLFATSLSPHTSSLPFTSCRTAAWHALPEGYSGTDTS